jgi:hypothetical protein
LAAEYRKQPDQPLYAFNDIVTLTATPDPGWRFSSWSGDLTGTDPVSTFAMNSDRAITATFVDEGVPTAHVLSPNGGEILVVGSEYKLTWAASDLISVAGSISPCRGTTARHTRRSRRTSPNRLIHLARDRAGNEHQCHAGDEGTVPRDGDRQRRESRQR